MFMDSVHGYIKIPKCFVDHLIDTEMFQRLRNIDQTGMRVLYPNAKHDRFGHSLGVYHLGYKAVDALLDNISNEKEYQGFWNISSDGRAVVFWAKNKLLFLIACLLHDIGHTPFSHALEHIIAENSREGTETLEEQLRAEIMRVEGSSEIIEPGEIDASDHELIGALYILQHFKGAIESIYADLIENGYPYVESDDFLFAEHCNNKVTIDALDIDNDMAFIVRMIIRLKYKSFQPDKQIKNCFIELLNSKNFDVDKLDYVIRDTKMSGISNISIDADRLLNSICMIVKTRYKSKKFDSVEYNDVVATKIANSNKNNTITIKGRYRGVFKIKTGSEIHIFKDSTFESLLPKQGSNEKIKYNNNTTCNALFSSKSSVTVNGRVLDPQNPEAPIELEKNYYEPFAFSIRNAKLLSDEFYFDAVGDEHEYIELTVNGKCDMSITGDFFTDAPVRFFGVELSGDLSEYVISKNYIDERVPDENCFNEFSIGFKKQAINVIANVMEARDYLNLWVFAHHKVVYYANFLIPILTNNVIKPMIKDNQFPSWGLNYKNIELLDDAYVWTAIKSIYKDKNDELPEVLLHLCEDLFSRKYMRSLYKSLAEFDLLFERISSDERMDMKTFLNNSLSDTSPCYVFREAQRIGYLNESIVKSIKGSANNRLEHITEIVYVDADYKYRILNTDETFIDLKGSIATLGEIPLLANKSCIDSDITYYFYLYYRTDTNYTTAEEAILLKETIRDYLIKEMKAQHEKKEDLLQETETLGISTQA